MRKFLRPLGPTVALLFLFALSELWAQITVPFPSFTAGTTIQPDEVNANFAKFGDALNRTGGTMTGTIVTRQVTPDANNTYDLGVTGTRFRDGWFGRNVDIGGTLGVSGATSLGASLTTRDLLVASHATYDIGTSAARYRDLWLSRNATIGGTLGVTGDSTFTNILAAAHNTYDIGVTGTRFRDLWIGRNAAIAGDFTAAAARFGTGVISPSAITADQNDYAPTGFSGASVVRVSHNNAGGNRAITGIAAGAAGREITICFISTSSTETLTLTHDSASSTAANRFINPGFVDTVIGAGQCLALVYDGVTSRWRILASPPTFTRLASATAQPGFLAYNSANDTPSDPATIDFDTEVYDTANNFSADTFTAPVTGIYQLCTAVGWGGNSNPSAAYLRIVTSNRSYTIDAVRAPTGTYGSGAGGCVHADMDASDTATVQLADGIGTLSQVDGGSSPYRTWFSGRLVP